MRLRRKSHLNCLVFSRPSHGSNMINLYENWMATTYTYSLKKKHCLFTEFIHVKCRYVLNKFFSPSKTREIFIRLTAKQYFKNPNLHAVTIKKAFKNSRDIFIPLQNRENIFKTRYFHSTNSKKTFINSRDMSI